MFINKVSFKFSNFIRVYVISSLKIMWMWLLRKVKHTFVKYILDQILEDT